MNNQAPLSGLIKVLVYLLIAVGIPVGVGAVFSGQWTENPILAVLLLITYELVIIVVRFTGRVWERVNTNS